MLVLSRQRDESIEVRLPDGRTLLITVVDIRPDKVRLGFTAPEEVEIVRSENSRRWRGRRSRGLKS